MKPIRSVFSALVCAAALTSTPTLAVDQQPVNVNINVVPVASISIVGSDLLALTVPPSKSTVNTLGSVHFLVTGNASATVVAEPDAYVEIPGQGFMGRAVLNSGVIGYQIQVTFPNTTVTPSRIAIASLPLDVPEGTYPALSVPLPLTNGQRGGTIDLLASADWTPDGALPLPGVYVGEIIITVTAGNL